MKKNRRRFWITLFATIIILILLGVLLYFVISGNTQTLGSDEFEKYLTGQSTHEKPTYWKFSEKDSNNTKLISGELQWKDGTVTKFVYEDSWDNFKTTIDEVKKELGSGPLQNKVLLTDLKNIHVSDRNFIPAWESWLQVFIPIVIMIIILVALLVWMNKQAGAGLGGVGSSAKFRPQKSKIHFTDVAGIKEEKQELTELVDYLKRPQIYIKMGAHAPKGILLIGPPGTGKTLLAKAVAGEANVPFYSVAGSEFEEVFVGLGASRIRTLFDTAKKTAPCIIFVDEIDAVASKRSAAGIGNGAGDQTLNQLLVEMDGFESNNGVLIIAATNRGDVLDPALVRPGRFDRQIQISLPDVREREAILRLHARNKNVAPSVSYERLAQATPGFSGAQLENLLNEAALLAVRYNKTIITTKELDEATDRVIAGPAKRSRMMTKNDRQIVSYHEAGHALIGLKLEHASKVHKITIIPRGHAGGYTVMTPTEESMFYAKDSLLAMIAGFMGGRAAEEILFGPDKITTGASDDFQKATNLARKMVTEFGMTELGMVQLENDQQQRAAWMKSPYSDEMAAKIDVEVNKLINEAYKLAVKIIRDNREELELLAESLRVLETITDDEINYIEKHGKLPPNVISAKEQQEKENKMFKEGKAFEVSPD